MFLLFIAFLSLGKSFFSQTVSTPALSQGQLCQIAERVAVKVTAEQDSGSGILIRQQEDVYTVLTVAHFLGEKEQKYKIQTENGQVHQGFLLARFDQNKSEEYDLALLQFRSPFSSYETANLSLVEPETKVMAGGYPVLSSGEIYEVRVSDGLPDQYL